MDLSLVIICCDDLHVFVTIDSVDVDVPIIVSLVPNADLEARLRARGVDVRLSIRGNYSTSANRGLAAVKSSCAFIVDSDCKLEPGCLSLIGQLLEEAPLARARVHYEYAPYIPFSTSIAQMRNQMVNERFPVRAYTPGLGLRMDLAPALGGFFFDERVFWAVGSEFSRRVYQRGIKVVYSPDAVITHAPIPLGHELRSAYKLGMGTRVQVELGLRPGYESPNWLVKRFRNWVKAGFSRGVQSERDLPLRFTYWAWTVAFYIGYYRTSFR